MEITLGPNRLFWALMNPAHNLYVGGELNAGVYSKTGSQKEEIILTLEHPGPVKVDFESLPPWAKSQINKSAKNGSISVEGMSVVAAKVVQHAKPLPPNTKDILNESVPKIKELLKNETPEVLKQLLEIERKGKARASLVSFIEEQVGPSL